MADSFIQLPADGAGKELDTRTQPDGEHREVVVLGDPDATDVAGVSAANGLEVDVTRVQGTVAVSDGGGSLTVDGTVAVTDGGSSITVDDGGGAITVDGAVSVSGTVTVEDGGSTISVDDGGGSLTIDGTVSVTGSVDTELPVAASLADNTSNPTVPAVGGYGMVYDGAAWDRMRGDSADGVLVNLGANNDVVVSGTVSVSEPVSVDDNGGSLTVDDGGTTLSVDDGGSSLTVDGTVSISGEVDVTPASPAAGAYLPVRLTDGSAFYTASGGGGSAPSHVDDAAFTVGTDDVAPIGALADESGTDTVDEGDVGAVRMTTDRKLLTRVVGATDANRLDVDASGHAQVDIAAASVTVPVSDAGGSLTVDGTVTVTDGGSSISVDDNGGSLTVDNAALAVTGGGAEASALRVTIANDSTGVVSVDDNGSTLSVDDGGGSLTVDGTVAVSGTVTVDTELPSATALADDTANPTVPGVGAFGMVYDGTTWDRARGTAVDGLLVNLGSNNDVVVSDGGGSITVDGTVSVTEPVSVDDNGGSLTVDDGGLTLSVDDGGGALTVDGSVSIGAALPAGTNNIGDVDVLSTPDQKTEDAAHSSGDVGSFVLGVRNDSATARTSTDGDYSPISTDSAGRVGIADLGGSISVDDNGSTLSVDDGGGSLTVDGTVAVSGTVTVDSELPTAAALADNAANPTAPAVGAFGMLWDGAAWDRAPGTSADGQLVNLGANNDVTVTGTVTTQGGAAADAPVSGNPNLVGARASDAVPTAVSADGDAVSLWADLQGAARTNERRATGTPTEGAFTATTDTQILAAATTRKSLSIANDSDRVLFVRYGPTAVTTSAYKVRIPPGGMWVDDGWAGEVRGILDGAIGSGQVRYSAEA